MSQYLEIKTIQLKGRIIINYNNFYESKVMIVSSFKRASRQTGTHNLEHMSLTIFRLKKIRTKQKKSY